MPRQKLPKLCNNIRCGTTVSPLWRKGWDREDGTNARLCNACGLHWRKGHFCPYPWCMAIYKEHETEHFDDDWIRCAGCSRWSHTNCVIRGQTANDSEDSVSDSAAEEEGDRLKLKRKQLLQRPHYCPDCDGTACATVAFPMKKNAKKTSTASRSNKRHTKSATEKKSPTKRKVQQYFDEDSYDEEDTADEEEEEEDEQFVPVPKKRRSSITSIHFRGSARMKARRRDSLMIIEATRKMPSSDCIFSRVNTTTVSFVTSQQSAPTTKDDLKIDPHVAKQLIQQKFQTTDEACGLSSLWAVCEIELRNLSKV